MSSHAETELHQLDWRKARRSMANGDCVEIAAARGQVFVRDSKQPNAATLAYSARAWTQFLQSVQLGGFDLPKGIR